MNISPNAESALANYQQTLLLNPAVWENYEIVAELQAQLKNYEKAIATLAEARARFPERPELTYDLALALSVTNRHQEAVTKFEEALRAWGGRFESETYEGAHHGWTVPGVPVYNEKQSDRHFRKLEELFAVTLA